MNFSNIKSIEIPQGVVKQITTSQGVVLWQAGPTDYSKRYLTLVARDSGTLQFDGTTDGTTTNTIQYSTDNGQTWSTAAQSATVNVSNGDKVLWKGEMVPFSGSNNKGIGIFTASTASFDIEGNIMSLLYRDNFNNVDYSQNYIFYNLFNSTKCITANNLILPSTYVRSSSYDQMFLNCSRLLNAPALPATTVATSCYKSMFGGCSSLIIGPSILPALSLRNCGYCYQSMFEGCTALTTAPALPATTLDSMCYANMFYGCTALTTAPELPATTLAQYCYKSMFYNTNVLPDCSNIDFTNSNVIKSKGLSGLFSGTKVTDNYLRNILPINSATNHYYLPVTTLGSYCYQSMFSYCTSLTTAPELPATTLVKSCYSFMFNGCTSLTTAPKLPATDTTITWAYQKMFMNSINLNYINMLGINISSSCLQEWVNNVAATGIFVKNIDATWTDTGVSSVPRGWTVIYYDTTEDKYYLDQQKSQECDDHGNAI